MLFLCGATAAFSQVPVITLKQLREHPELYHGKDVRFVTKIARDWEGAVIGDDPKDASTWMSPDLDRSELSRTSKHYLEILGAMLKIANDVHVLGMADSDDQLRAVEIDAEGTFILGSLTPETMRKQAKEESVTQREIEPRIVIKKIHSVRFSLATKPNKTLAPTAVTSPAAQEPRRP